MKRDLNFLKHIKPQLKEKEQRDKYVSKQIKYEKACQKVGIPSYSATDNDINMSLIAAIMSKLSTNKDEVHDEGSKPK